MGFERTGGETVWQGRLLSVRVERFRHDDGGEAVREIVHHDGAAAVLALDGDKLLLVRQPREAVGEQALLELPAGRLDRADEDPLEAAQRELAEEVGKGARRWRALTSFYSTAGFTDEVTHLFLATDLFDVPAVPPTGERIEVVELPLDQLSDAVDGCRDAKTLIGLLWLLARPAQADSSA